MRSKTKSRGKGTGYERGEVGQRRPAWASLDIGQRILGDRDLQKRRAHKAEHKGRRGMCAIVEVDSETKQLTQIMKDWE